MILFWKDCGVDIYDESSAEVDLPTTSLDNPVWYEPNPEG